jgi:hypothetical protein
MICTLTYMELIEHLRLVPNSAEVKRLLYLFEDQLNNPMHWVKGRPNAVLRANKGILVKLYQESLKINS